MKTIVITIKNESSLRTIKGTNAFRNYLPNIDSLQVGDNIVKVNNYGFRRLMDNQLFGKATVVEFDPTV